MQVSKKFFIGMVLALGAFFTFQIQTPQAQAQSQSVLTAEIEDLLAEDATASASESSESTSLASPSAEVQQKVQQKKDEDLTDTSGVQKSKLAAYLDEHPPGPLSWNNFMQHLINFAVGEGVPANVIVLVILFPLVASLIAVSRHMIGLRGFGIYIPAVLAVAFVSTGILPGIVLFGAIAVFSWLTKFVLRQAKMAYLPRTALQIWMVSLGILLLMVLSPLLNLTSLMVVNIFPVLILVMLSENFLDALSRTKPTDAVALTSETIILAVVSSLVMQLEIIQKFALTEPELLIVLTALVSIVIGKFSGLRLTEILRFRGIIEEE